MEKASRKYFEKDTIQVAKNFLGAFIVRKDGQNLIRAKIVETEAYLGPEDQASHTRNSKRTYRNKVVWKPGGYAYIYLTYGIHWMFNIVTQKKDVPECVLIRAVDVKDLDFSKTNGPGKLTKRLEIDKGFYGEDLTKSSKIWIEKGEIEKALSTPRINIDSAGEPWISKKWRFLIAKYKDNLPKPQQK